MRSRSNRCPAKEVADAFVKDFDGLASKSFDMGILVDQHHVAVTLHVAVPMNWEGNFDFIKPLLVNNHEMPVPDDCPVFVLSSSAVTEQFACRLLFPLDLWC
ncbi:hypothetical protein PoB_006640000 [Plakobranchus ocellatus]|uniref:Uncharacterized protein n=1 Tax=Plakobranchus ocellatus TaxID=259542 RepID=A0AAV4D6Y5_9GAST|nr:hypothetical protein PoB_006640000 [Plakobranchus ocellatus]